ncbi:GtrA family protein [Sediminibacterium soli]|uniref:GtrA family protein n=1 Tax=Sediminibacterium soli TaxID=2698829 RepID=UPI00137AA875|nr:GtrA family protein [Sediminibacterium soli]NCI45169.1 GtrA family protein [Sediminibacterium soli]
MFNYRTFIRAQASSFTASATDFAVTVVLKEWAHCWYLLASILGTVSGGIVNFSMNRRWVFAAHNRKMFFQAVKYVLVWVGNLVLVSLGVFLMTDYGKIGYLVSKITVSLFVGFFYNYTLQKRFVFKQADE